MTNVIFQSELKILKELAAEFAMANPALAPLLDGEMTDPDVERLLEAIVYQNTMLRQKLEADFPELINKLTHLILPHYMRPIPASTVMAFSLEKAHKKTVTISCGTVVSSAAVDGTACCFTTTGSVELQPLELVDVTFLKQSGSGGLVRLSLALKGITLDGWEPKKLRFFLSGELDSACDLFLLFNRYLKQIILTPVEGGAAMVLPAESLRSIGFSENEALLPYPSNAFSGYRLLQEYFTAPEKYLFFELTGWEKWEYRGEGNCFTICFEFSDFPSGYPRVRPDSFALNCVPAVNIFSHSACPVTIDHRTDRYPIRPAGANPDHYQVLSVDGVTGFSRASRSERKYSAFELFDCEKESAPLYQAVQEPTQNSGGLQINLSVVYPGEMPLAGSETLSIDLTCSNGTLPENLHIGDICHPESILPDMVTCRNISPIKAGQLPPLGPQLLRQLTTHLYLNHLSLESAEHLRMLLELYVFPDRRSGAATAANLKRIAGIESISIKPSEQMVAGIPMKGREISIRVRQDHFAGAGDMYLFGCVLDNYFGRYASMNTFTRLVMNESIRGGSTQWATRLGKLPLQ